MQVSLKLTMMIFYLPGAFGLRLVESEIPETEVPKIVYAVLANRNEKYVKILETHFDTWAGQAVSEGRYFATVGEGPIILQQKHQSALKETSCDDGYQGLACKEFVNLEEGLKRKADWLVIIEEDKYVNTSAVEKGLAELTEKYKTLPIAMGVTGCALWECPELPDKAERGSICGGGGFILNRAALLLLFKDGSESLRTEYLKKAGSPNDVITACALQKRGGELVNSYDVLDGKFILHANRLATHKEIENAILDEHAVMIHLNDAKTLPEDMYYAHYVEHSDNDHLRPERTKPAAAP